MNVFFFQAEDCIRDLVRSRGLGDVYKRQEWCVLAKAFGQIGVGDKRLTEGHGIRIAVGDRLFLSLIHI